MNKTIQGVGHIFYPESCPVENIIEYVFPNYPCAISPIHNRDKDRNGKLKKAHYHLLFQGKLTEKDKKYISKFTGIAYFENIYSFYDAYLYLYHWNRKTDWFIPNKAQYWSADIIYSERWSDDYTDRTIDNSSDITIRDIFNIIRVNSITEIKELYDYALDNNDDSFFNVTFKYERQIGNYIRSIRCSERPNVNNLMGKLKREAYMDNTLLEYKGSYIDLHSYRVALEMKYRDESIIDGLTKINFPIDIE